MLSGEADPAQFEHKLVLIGVTGLGLIDYQATPLGERMPGIEIHAQLLESIFDGTLLRRPAWLAHLERMALIVCTVLLMLTVPRLRPRYAAPILAAMLAALALLGFALFTTMGLLFDPAFPAAGATVAFGVLLGGTLAESDRHKRRLERALQTERDAALRTAGELEAAWRIQMGMLPPPTAEALHEPRIELQARIEPARLVGGDFYDYFLLDADRLFFCIGDVAGKGLPASLFMAVCKALLKSIALRAAADAGLDLGTLMRTAEREIARDNPEMLFVTLFIGVLQLRSGELTYCNAGHEPPYLMPEDGSGPQPLAGEAGPPLGVLEAFPYTQSRGSLARGDTLVLYTDGVTEAMNRAGHLYGRQQLAALLASMARGNTPAEVVSSVGWSVRGFVGDAEQSDDFTLLALRRRRESA